MTPEHGGGGVSVLVEYVIAGGLGVLGRYVGWVRATNPRSWQAWALFEVPSGLAMGVIGKAGADWMNASESVEYGIIVATAMAGPHVVERVLDLLEALARKRGGIK